MSYVEILSMMTAVIYSRFESFNNEILLDILEYLDAYKLCQTFYWLNYRFNTFHRPVYLHVVCDSNIENVDIWYTLTSCFRPLQIYTLSVNDSIIFDMKLFF